MKKKVYITTPIYYASGKPHLGHAYTTLLADVLARYKKLLGYDVYFATGLDEFGEKIYTTAKKNNLTPKEFVKLNKKDFIEMYEALGVEYDGFIETTDEYHIQTVQTVFEQFLEQKEIYLDNWTGYYCVSCEENYTETNIVEKQDGFYCKIGHILEKKSAESYFLKITKHLDWLKTFLDQNDLVYPSKRVNEIYNSFLNDEKFSDLSVSRINLNWGIEVKSNKKHVVYVWLDALLNYISILGFKNNQPNLFDKYWNNKDGERIHIMSKEIIRFHCIYWPIILKLLNINQPTKYLVHGWIITKEGKMSKSLGNVIHPFDLLKLVDLDGLRYYLIKEVSLKDDSVISLDHCLSVYNSDLANNIGNIFSRFLGMVKKYQDNKLQQYKELDHNLLNEIKANLDKFDESIESKINSLILKDVIEEVLSLINQANLLIEKLKPWTLDKQKDKLIINNFLVLLWNVIKRSFYYLSPILINTYKAFLEFIDKTNIPFNKADVLDLNSQINIEFKNNLILFPRK